VDMLHSLHLLRRFAILSLNGGMMELAKGVTQVSHWGKLAKQAALYGLRRIDGHHYDDHLAEVAARNNNPYNDRKYVFSLFVRHNIATSLDNASGYRVGKGTTVRMRDGTVEDAYEWLKRLGIKNGEKWGTFSIREEKADGTTPAALLFLTGETVADEVKNEEELLWNQGVTKGSFAEAAEVAKRHPGARIRRAEKLQGFVVLLGQRPRNRRP
jgi:hypothetical protein